MKRTRSLRYSVISVYILSLILFVGVIITFTIIYQNSYVNGKLSQARSFLATDDLTVEDAIYKLTSDGYSLYFQSKNVDARQLQDEGFLKEPVTTVVYSKIGQYGHIVINGSIEAHIDDTLITEFASDLYIVIIATVLIYIAVTLIFVQYFVLQIVNPLTKINNELRRISEFDFEGTKLEFKSHGEIQMLAQSVENIKVSLRSYNRNRTALVSALVHELKSPVATISSVIQLNKMKHEKYDDEVTVQIIEESIETISSITKMSLEIFEKQTIYKMMSQDMIPFISEQLSHVKPKLDEKELKVVINGDSTIWDVDIESFALIMSNLLNNICNYSKKGSVVDVKISNETITFTNDIAEEFTSGTGKGLKIISSLLNDMGMGLEYFEDNGKYHLIITRRMK
ncbi:MAG: hypothetical protein ACK5K7_07360 [Bacilli bacterium]